MKCIKSLGIINVNELVIDLLWDMNYMWIYTSTDVEISITFDYLLLYFLYMYFHILFSLDKSEKIVLDKLPIR